MRNFVTPIACAPNELSWLVEYHRQPDDDPVLFGPFAEFNLAEQYGVETFGGRTGWHVRSIWPVHVNDNA